MDAADSSKISLTYLSGYIVLYFKQQGS